jgi:hypothetical protein
MIEEKKGPAYFYVCLWTGLELWEIELHIIG